MSLEQEKQAEFEIQQLLESIPRAEHFPVPRDEVVDAMIFSLEGTIKRLKAFVSFLSLLNPMQYLKWMTEAYARYVPSTKATDNKGQAQAELETPIASELSPSKKSGKRSGNALQRKTAAKSRRVTPA